MRKSILILLVCSLFIGCSQTKSKIALPYKTSYGNLVRIEKKDTVKTMRTPDMGQFRIPEVQTHLTSATEELYLLSFEGVDSIISINKGIETKEKVSFNFKADITITGENMEATGPEFIGYLTQEGLLTSDNSQMILLMPASESDHYKMVTRFPVSKISVLFKLPKNSSDLFLNDGKNLFQIR